jgi:hypothetical protein
MYCGAAIDGAAAPARPQLDAAQAAAIAAVTHENRARSGIRLTPEQALNRHLLYAAIGLVAFAAITLWTPAGALPRLVLFLGGPIVYALLLVLHYGLVRDHERALVTACEESEGRFWLVTGACFLVGAAGVLVVLTHLGLIRPSYRRPQAIWNTLVVLVAAGAASVYFVWFGIRLLRARRG